MSAGIVIMNKNAIAMAADSAVTVGDHVAIHNSANKLFALSVFEPVGVIIYANAQFMQIPMEIIIKQYKSELGRRSFSFLEEYVDNFITFLETHSELFHFSKNEEAYVLDVCANLLKGLANDYKFKMKRLLENVGRPLQDNEIEQIQTEAIAGTMQYIDGQNKISDIFSDYIKSNYFDRIIELIRTNFDWLQEPKNLAEKICELFDTDFMRNGYMGVAVAGYGKKEVFPHMVHLKFSGILNGKLRYKKLEDAVISEENQASITPLAQTDVMETFISGFNDDFMHALIDSIPKAVEQRINSIAESSINTEKKEEIKAAFNGFINEVIGDITNYSRQNYVRPIVLSVAALPIEELALFAESMINITSVRRRVAIDGNIGTVGGPIDVAIITRGDGLIWLKRKHYFEAKKNPQFMFSRYGQPIREVNNDEENK